VISLLTVDGDLWIATAIWRIVVPAAMPREISSRSVKVRASRERRRLAGAIPPLRATTPKIDAACLPKALPISLNDWPFFHRSHSSAFRSADSPGRPICDIHTSRSVLDQVVLRRPIEPTTAYFAKDRL
jgi:hypothetical protein